MPAADPPVTDDGAAPPQQPSPPPPPPPQPQPRPLSLASALPFWFYLAAFVSVLALLLPHVVPPPSSSSLPPLLRDHLAAGRVLKLHPSSPDLFAVTSRPSSTAASGGSHAHHVLVLPGLAAGTLSFRRVLSSLASRGGLHATALDLPGQGLSPPLPPPASPSRPSALREIIDRGVFHAFEHLVETGEVPYQAESSPTAATPRSPSPHAPDEAAAAIARAADALGLGPVHLVLHDTALVAGALFASAHPGAVRSVTLLDAPAAFATVPAAAFPAAVLDVPVLGRLVLRVPALFRGLLRLCCARGVGAEEAEAYRAAMRGEGKAEGVVEAWKAVNQSFRLAEWRGSSEEVRRMPVMVLWSGAWSDLWIDEGKKVAAAVPDARFVYHSGGRWPQVDAFEEISGLITEFVTSVEEAAGGHIE